MTISTTQGHLIDNARSRGDQPALHVVVGDTVTMLTWAELLRRSAAYADRYLAAGVQPGDVVMLCLRHSVSQYPAYLGALLAGMTPSFVSFPTPKQDPVQYWDAHRVLFGRVQPHTVLTYAENAADLAKVVPESTGLLVDAPAGDVTEAVEDIAARFPLPDLDSVALLQHSSGTTGQKKGVMLTHRHIGLQTANYTAAMEVSELTRVASWLPLYHDMGLFTGFLMPVHWGATVVSIDAFEWVAQPHLLLELMDRYSCDHVWLPNFAFNHMARTKRGDETYQLGHVRSFVCSSEPVKADTIDHFVETFAPHGVRPIQMRTHYGMAEATLAISVNPPGTPVPRIWFDTDAVRRSRAVVGQDGPGTVGYLSNGRLIGGIELRVDPVAAAVPGEGTAIGELQIRGDFVFDGYYRNPEATAEAFAGDGWYRTGDLGAVIDAEVYVFGRSKDVIIHHGVNYYAHDLEAVATTVPGVKAGRCAAVAVYDDSVGSERIELIAEREHVDADLDAQLQADLKHAIADRFPITVARVHLVEQGWLVKTTSGKVSRADNLAKLLAQPPSPPPPPETEVAPEPPRNLAELVVSIIASTFGVPAADIDERTTAVDVEGWDSLGHTVLMIRISRALGVNFPEFVAADADDVGELIELLRPWADMSR
jgi:fatty-acyl-CoA synthase